MNILLPYLTGEVGHVKRNPLFPPMIVTTIQYYKLYLIIIVTIFYPRTQFQLLFGKFFLQFYVTYRRLHVMFKWFFDQRVDPVQTKENERKKLISLYHKNKHFE